MRLIQKLWRAGYEDVIPHRLPAVIADNVDVAVTDWCFSEPPDTVRSITELPPIRPPFEDMWIEAETKSVQDSLNGWAKMWGFRITKGNEYASVEGRPNIVEYNFTFFMEAIDGTVASLSRYNSRVGVGKDGIATWAITVEPNAEINKLSPAMEIGRGNATYTACFALSLMHCSNVSTREVTAPRGNTYTRIGKKQPVLRYHVLEIDHVKRTLRTDGEVQKQGLSKALHICRGHFKRFDKPLFGKTWTGTLWVPAHFKGSAEVGTVVKDYKIK